MADTTAIPAEVLAALEAGNALVCLTRCEPCQFGWCPRPRHWHSWAGDEDIEHAKTTGQPDPRTSICGCSCAGAPVKALTIHRPWAELIAAGHKRVENRTWYTHHRGPLVIHAGQKTDKHGVRAATELGVDLPAGVGPTGYIAVAQLVDVHYQSHLCGEACDPWGMPLQYHWVLADVKRFDTPIAGPGRQGLAKPPAEVLRQVQEATRG